MLPVYDYLLLLGSRYDVAVLNCSDTYSFYYVLFIVV